MKNGNKSGEEKFVFSATVCCIFQHHGERKSIAILRECDSDPDCPRWWPGNGSGMADGTAFRVPSEKGEKFFNFHEKNNCWRGTRTKEIGGDIEL